MTKKKISNREFHERAVNIAGKILNEMCTGDCNNCPLEKKAKE